MTEADTKRIPGYAKPNLSSKLPASLGCQHETIRAAFAPGSYTSISDLGKGPTALEKDFNRVNENSQSFKAGTYKGLFTEFEYSASPYDLNSELQCRERRQHHSIVGAIAGTAPFVAPGNSTTMKYEGTYSYDTDPFDTIKDEALRGKWMEERKVLAGPFIPSGRDKSLSKPSRTLLTDIMTNLYRVLSSDWSELKPTIFTTAEDLLVIYFFIENLKSTHGLLAYMNVMVRRSSLTERYDLRKVNEGWGIKTEDSHLMFALRPPWVKEKNFTSFEASPVE